MLYGNKKWTIWGAAVALFVVLFSFSAVADAANTCHSNTPAGGDWNSTSSWTDCGGNYPQIGDDVIIDLGERITIPAGVTIANINNLTVLGVLTQGNKLSQSISGTLTVGDSAALSGTAVSGTTTTVVDASADTPLVAATNGFYIGMTLVITGGVNAGESRIITGYTASTKTITVAAPFPTAITATSAYSIYATLTHSPNTTWAATPTYIVNFSASAVTVNAGGVINVSGMGYKGGTTAKFQGDSPSGAGAISGDSNGGGGGGGQASATYGGGGAHAGNGNAASKGGSGSGGTAYDDALNPASLGSGGGASYSSATSATAYYGGAGGGLVSLTVTGELSINGRIMADGQSGHSVSSTYGGGGGGGGAINITAGSLAGSGLVTANGGNAGYNGSFYYGGAGGGGMIAIKNYSNATFPLVAEDGSLNVKSYGGVGYNNQTYGNPDGYGNTYGGSGTVYLKSSSSTNGSLIVDNGATTTTGDHIKYTDPNYMLYLSASTPLSGPDIVVDSMTVSNGARYLVKNGKSLTVNSNTLGASAYNAELRNEGSLTIGVSNLFTVPVHVSLVQKNSASSTLVNSSSLGLTVNGRFEMDSYLPDSTPLTLSSLTVKSGGVVSHTRNTTTLAHVINLSVTGSGGVSIESGGKFDVSGAGFLGGVTPKAMGFSSPTTSITGTADSGTATSIVDADLTQPDDTFNGMVVEITSGPNIGSTSIISDFVSSTHTLVLGTALLYSSAGETYRIFDGTGGGKGASVSSTYGGGGAHAGDGNAANKAGSGAGGVGYDNAIDPVMIGAGGGASYSSSTTVTKYYGGTGGGLIKLSVTNNLDVSGTITADGFAGHSVSGTYGGGGGGGGAINITAGSLSGSGSVTANGGAATLYYGGGGGGGIISIKGYTYTDDGVFPVEVPFSIVNKGGVGYDNGFGYAYGGAGTTFLQKSTSAHGHLIVDNGAIDDTFVNYSNVNTMIYLTANTSINSGDSYTVSNLTVKDGARYVIASGGTLNLEDTELGASTYNAELRNNGTLNISDRSAPFTIPANVDFVHNRSGTLTESPSLKLVVAGRFTTDNYKVSGDGSSPLELSSLTVNSGGIVTHTRNTSSIASILTLFISGVDGLTINDGGAVDVSGMGYQGGYAAKQQGSSILGVGTTVAGANGGGGGGGQASATYGGGGGHGGAGGTHAKTGSGAGGAANDSVSNPTDLGAGGGASYSSSTTITKYYGGAGGGFAKLAVANTLTISGTGTIAADGAAGHSVSSTYGGGGGAGGTIDIAAGSLVGNGSMSADGGNSGFNGSFYYGGGGGGGIIKTSAADVSDYSGSLSVAGGTGGTGGNGSIGAVSTEPETSFALDSTYTSDTWSGTISGTASVLSPSTISKVEIKIQRSSDSKYYDGASSWTDAETWLTATGTTSWSYALDKSNLSDGVDYTVTTRGTNDSSIVESSPTTDTFAYSSSVATPPTITSIDAVTSNGSYMAGTNIDIAVTFSEPVTVTGTPRIELETGSIDRFADYLSGSTTNTLTFRYAVQAGDIASDLNYKAVDSLGLNSGTINSGTGTASTLTLPTVGGGSDLAGKSAIIIDTTPPATIASVGQPDGYSNSTSLDITVTDPSAMGNVVTYYKYKLGLSASTDCSVSTGYGSETAIATHIITDISGVSDGVVKLCLIGRDLAGNWQAYADAYSVTWTKDTAEPVITPTLPSASTIVASAAVDYNLGETAASGTIVWTRTSGTEDGFSPHTSTLTGDALAAMSREPAVVAFDVDHPLVSGTVYTVTFSFTDAAGNISTSNVTGVTYLSNTAPTTSNSTNTFAEDADYSEISVTAADIDGDTLTYIIVSGPSHGTLKDGDAIIGSYPHRVTGMVTYKPEANFNGDDSVTFKVNDGAVDSNVSTLTITMTQVNDLPTAADATVSVAEDNDYTFASSDFNFMEIDTGDSLTSVMITQLESAGALKLSGVDVTLNQEIPISDIIAGNFKFTPAANANGTGYANFKYKLKDNTGYSVSAYTMTIDVTAANDAPTLTALASPPDMTEDVPLSFTYDDLLGAFGVNDPDGDAVSFKVGSVLSGTFEKSDGAGGWVSAGTGTLISSGESARWMPAANANGTIDALTLKVTDGSLDSDAVTVTFNVAAANDAPVASDQSVSTEEEVAKAITLSATDADSDTLTYSIVAEPSHGSLSGTPPNVTYTPAANYNGSDSFTFKANDGTADSNTATVSITVTPSNDAPTLTSFGTPDVPEDTAAPFTYDELLALSNASDPDGDTLTLVVQSVPSGTLQKADGEGGFMPAGEGATFGPGESGVWTPAANATGTVEAIIFKVSDGELLSGAATLSIALTPVNDVPTLTAISTLTGEAEDSPTTISYATLAAAANESDVDGDALSFRVEAVSSGTLTKGGTPVVAGTTTIGAGESLVWTPAANASGTLDAFTVKAFDGTAPSATAVQVKVAVAAANDAPTVTAKEITTNEDVAGTVDVSSGAGDLDGDTLTYTVVGAASHGTCEISGVTLTYTPAANFNGSDSCTFKANDGSSDSNIATVTITVAAVNDAPSFVKGADQTAAAGAQSVTGWATSISNGGGADEAEQTLTFNVNNTNETTGLFDVAPAVAANGTLTYTVGAGQNGVANFSVTLSDNGGGATDTSAAQTFTITVDTTGPTAPTVDGTTPTADTTPTWTWVAGTGGNGTFRYQLDSEAGSWTETTATSYTADTLAGGEHTLYVQERDSVGNWSASGSKAITIDVTGPVAATASVEAGTYNAAQSVTLSVAGDAAATYYTLNGDEPTSSSTLYEGAISIDAASGTITLKAVSYDALGNKGATLSVAYVFDKAGPTAPTVDGTTPTADTTPTWTWVAGTGGNGTFRYQLDSEAGSWTETTATSYTADTLAGGEHTLYVQERDAVGNWSASGSKLILIDRAPVLAAIDPQSVNENSLLSFTVSATDADGNAIVYSASGLPEGATFNADTRTFTWTPTFDQAGSYDVTFTATAGAAHDDKNTTITVANVNRAPIALERGILTDEDVAKSITLGGTDPDSVEIVLTTEIVTGPSHGTLSGTLPSVTYTPDTDYNGTDTFTFRVSDGELYSEPATVTFTVTPADDAPVLDAIGPQSVNENQLLSFTIRAADPDGDAITYSAMNMPEGATLDESTGTFSWTPTYSQAGTYDVTFRASADVKFDSEIVRITVAAVNRAPTATAQNVSTDEDVAKDITLAGSDSDDGDTLTFTTVGCDAPSHGALSGLNASTGEIVYTPTGNYNGSDSFGFKVSDGTLSSECATVSITINSVDDDPIVATPISNVTVSEDAAASTISLVGVFSDNDNAEVTKNIASNSNAALVTPAISGDDLTLTYAPNVSGSSTIVVRGTTGVAPATKSVDASFTVTVNPENDPPVLVAIGPQSVAENGALSFTLSATDIDSETITFSATGLPEGATLDSSTGLFAWTPTYDQAGVYNITFTASDGSANDSEIVAVTVADVDQAPLLAAIGSRSVNEGATLSFTVSASDADAADELTYSTGDLPTGATFDAASRTFSWTPTFDQTGTYDIIFTVSDGTLEDSETVRITVNNANRTPVATAQSVETPEDTAVSITLAGSDEDAGTSLEYSIVTQPSHGVISGTPPNVTYTPAANYNGSDSFTFKVNDGTIDSGAATVSITVNSVDDDPIVATPISNVTVSEDAAASTISLVDVFSDNDNAEVTKSIASNSNAALVTPAISGDDLTLTYAPNVSGSSTIVVRGTTGVAPATKSVDASFTVTVTASDDAPVLAAIGEKSVAENASLSFTISATDIDSETMTFSATGLPTGATLDASSGLFTWTPTFAQSGVYNVTFIVTADGVVDSEIVPITVSNINQAPTLESIGAKSANEGAQISFAIEATDSDLGDTLTYSTGDLPTGASFDAASRTFSWTPTYDQAGTYDIVFRVSDGTTEDIESVRVTVANTNRAPIATPQLAVSVTEDVAKEIVLAGTDEDAGAELTYSIVTQPSHGAISGTPPNVTYTPAANYSGADSFTFKVNDGTADSAAATVTISVAAVNDIPVATAASISTNEDATASGTLAATDTEGAALTYSIVTNGTKGNAVVTNSSTGAFTYTPTSNMNGADSFTFKAVDASGGESAPATISVMITAQRDPPVFDAISSNNYSFTGSAGEFTFASVSENQTISFHVGATDPDNNGNALTVTTLGGLPSGATFTNGNFSWKPTFAQAQAENYTILFKATGSSAQSEFMVVNIPVVDVDRAPQFLGSISAQTVNENQGLTIVMTATDPDSDQLYFSAPVVQVTSEMQQQYSVNCSTAYLPQGAQLNGNTFTWTPTYQQSGQYCIAISVTDRAAPAVGLSALTIFKVTVSNVTTTPLLETVGDRTIAEGQVLSFQIRAMDPETGDDSTLSYGMTSASDNGYNALPLTAEFNQTTHLFTFSPAYTEAGLYAATFVVGKVGQQGTMAWESIFITVTNVDRAPTLASIGNKSVVAASALTFTLSGSDADTNDTLTYSAVGLPTGATLNGSTGAFAWTPTVAQVGTHSVVFKVTDNGAPTPLSSAEQTVVITVTAQQPEEGGGEDDPETFAAEACIKNLGSGDDCITDRLVASGSTVTLDASGSTAGASANTSVSASVTKAVAGSELAYEWTQVAGGGCPSVDFEPTEHEAMPTIVLPNAPDGYIMTCKFRVTVSNGTGTAESDIITVRVASNGYEDTEPNVGFKVYGQVSSGVVLEDPPLISSSISKDAVTEPTTTIFSVFKCGLDELIAWNGCERMLAFELPVVDPSIYDVGFAEGNTGEGGAKEIITWLPADEGAIYKFNLERALAFAQTNGVINPTDEQLTWIDRFIGNDTYKNLGAGLQIMDTDGDGVDDIVTKAKIYESADAGSVYIMSIKGRSYVNDSSNFTEDYLNFRINAGSDVDMSSVRISEPTNVTGDAKLMNIFVGGLGSMQVDTREDVTSTTTASDIFNSLVDSGKAKSVTEDYLTSILPTRTTYSEPTTEGGTTQCTYYYNGRCFNPPAGYVPPSNYEQYGYSGGFSSISRSNSLLAKAESATATEALDATNIATADVNGDTFDDTIVGAPDDGKVYIFFGTADFAGAKDPDEADVVINCLSDEDACGSVIVAGDVSTDGYADVIIGAPEADGEDDAYADAGEIYVIYGSKDWPASLDIATYPSVNFIYGLTENGLMGAELVLTDIDGNGTDELIANLANNTALVFTFDLKSIMGRTLMLSRVALDDLTGTVTAPKVMLRFNLTASTDESLTVNSIKVTASGSGVDSRHVKSVRLFNDVNRDGLLDELDTQLGTSQTFSSDNGVITFTGLGETIAAGSSEQWMVVYEFVDGSSSLNISMRNGEAGMTMTAILAMFLAPLFGAVVVRNRRSTHFAFAKRHLRMAACVLLSVGLVTVFASCGDNADRSNSQTEGDYTFKASIASSSDVEITGAGGTVDIIGAPLEGDEVTVNFKSVSSGTDTPVTGETSANYGIAGGGVGCSLIR